MTTVAVVGASGFVGSTLVERLLCEGRYKVRPLIHSSGNAWRLARLGIELFPADVLSEKSVQTAVQGCEFVVNCSRGSSDVMIGGLKNLLRVSRRCSVKRFVHLSSTAVFGERFTQTVVNEQHPVNAVRNSYGGKKSRQDFLVRNAVRRGLPAVVLCPPNITGPYSTYLQDVVQALQSGEFALVDGGNFHCSIVDVHNLVHAIVCAMTCSVADGRRLIVADSEPANWKQFAHTLAEVAGVDDVASIGVEEAERLTAPARRPRKSIVRAFRHAVSSDMREVLRNDPLWDSLHNMAVRVARRMPSGVQNWLKQGKPPSVPRTTDAQPNYNPRLIAQQLRNVRFASNRAATVLQYEPIVSFEDSLAAFRGWYRTHFGLNTDSCDLLELLK